MRGGTRGRCRPPVNQHRTSGQPEPANFTQRLTVGAHARRHEGQVPTSDDYLLYVQGSNSLNTLALMRQSFNQGSLDPYRVLALPLIKR